MWFYFYLHWNAAKTRHESTKMSLKWKCLSVTGLTRLSDWELEASYLALTSFFIPQFIIADAVNFICTTSFSTYGLIICVVLNRRIKISFFTSWLNVLQIWLTIEQHMLASLEKGLMIISNHLCIAGKFCPSKNHNPPKSQMWHYVLRFLSSNVSLTQMLPDSLSMKQFYWWNRLNL